MSPEVFRHCPWPAAGTVLGETAPSRGRRRCAGGTGGLFQSWVLLPSPEREPGPGQCRRRGGGGGEEGGSRLADCLPASYSGPLGEQSCLAVGGGPTAGSSWRRPGEGWQQQARSWRRQSQQPSPAAQISSAMNLKAPGSVLCGPAVVLSLRGTTEALLETLGPMVVHLGGPRNSCCN